MSLDIEQGTGTPHLENITRSALLTAKNGGNLEPGVFYCITDYNRGTVGAAEITVRAVSENEVSMHADVKTQFDDEAREGRYDIDTNRLTFLADNLDNEVTGQNAIDAFPWGNTAVYDNRILGDAQLDYTGGSVYGNIFNSDSNTSIAGGNFRNNVVESDANVRSDANVQRNHFEAQSNTTISAGDFRENRVENDATVTSSTTGDVDNNNFKSNSNTTVSGTANVDNNEVGTDANLIVSGGNVINNEFKSLSNTTVSGGTFADNEVGQDADVTIISGSNYENVFGKSTIYRQVGTGYVRYSNIEGTTAFINGNTNISNVNANTATINTTGSAGTLSNSFFQRAYMQNLQNIPSLTITDSTVANYGTVQTNGATRIYLYRSTVTDGSRVLVSANSRIDASYTNLSSYSYIQSTGNGGFLRVNYCEVTSLGYIRNLTTNTNYAERCEVSSQSSIRFDGNSDNCRVYYSVASSGGALYMTTGAVGCYFYYCKATTLGQMYCQNATSSRFYYSTSSDYSYVRKYGTNTGISYIYYCNASSRGFIEVLNSTGTTRHYAVNANSQSYARLSGTGNLYYSAFSAYYYLLMTRTGGTLSGAYGMGRRSFTVTNPTTSAPYNTGAARQNFS